VIEKINNYTIQRNKAKSIDDFLQNQVVTAEHVSHLVFVIKLFSPNEQVSLVLPGFNLNHR